MKKLFLIFVSFGLYVGANVTIHSTVNEKLPVAIVFVDKSKDLEAAGSTIKKDLEFSGQLEVAQKNIDKLTKEKILKLGLDYPLILFLSLWNGNLEWRLYDGLSAKMIKGKKVVLSTKDTEKEFVLHKISDQIFPLITSEQSSFSAAVVACKKMTRKDGSKETSIFSFYPSDPSNKKIVIKGGITLSPHWHPTDNILFYSEHTPVNVKLMMYQDGQKRVVSKFDGLNITPAFSPSGKIVVSITRSGKGRLCEYIFDKAAKKGKFVSLTGPDMHAYAPTFIDENRVVFSVIDAQRIPKVALINLKNKKVEFISSSSCLSPSYNKVRNEIIYCKKVDSGREVFAYDLKSKKERQLTADKIYKASCDWSPCGNWILFTEDRDCSRLATMNLSSGQKRYLSTTAECWQSPAWAHKSEEPLL